MECAADMNTNRLCLEIVIPLDPSDSVSKPARKLLLEKLLTLSRLMDARMPPWVTGEGCHVGIPTSTGIVEHMGAAGYRARVFSHGTSRNRFLINGLRRW